MIAVAAATLGFGPVFALDVDPDAVEAANLTARRNGVRIDVARADVLLDALPDADLLVANIELRVVEALLARRPAPRAITSGYLVHERPQLAGWMPVAEWSWTAGPPICSPSRANASKLGGRMATFSARFLGCKVSFADAQAIRERLLADGHSEVEEEGDIAVVNTCCVTHEAVSKSRQAVSRASRTHGRVYVTGCAANLEGAFTQAAANVTVVSARSEELADAVARDVGAIGCVRT